MDINKVGVIGAGTMGSGIAQVAATAGCQVKLFDVNQAQLDKAQAALEKIMNRLIEKGRIDAAEKTRIQSNIFYVSTVKDLPTLILPSRRLLKTLI
ncbi:3-hydroxybutyryl-CoA dehydrogenase [Nonlabens ulvanivorans]|nr:3-hydroxybutyryl-CoA dehydrogenase [Nonlabens ulvanivorans]